MSAVVRYHNQAGTALGLLSASGEVLPLRQQSWAELFSSDTGPQVPEGAEPVPGAELLCPVVRPGKVLCTGVNYASHKNENPAAVLPKVPFFFSKLPSALVGPGAPIAMPSSSTQLDYEVELAVLIGRRAKGLNQDNALDAVWGYTVINDVSARDVQFTDNQITLGKGFDGFCPLGPCVVPAADVPDPQALIVSSWVNGELRQQEPTANMLFSVAELLVHVSRSITLEPGDVVTTGTPAGVGYFMEPKGLLQPGDVVDVAVDGIGRLSNPVVAGW
jgi:2-keto-4-pentenoate hydratase/2-oxohepta-3-ene-1,7-dioic acid hydratase in catechol pathway